MDYSSPFSDTKSKMVREKPNVEPDKKKSKNYSFFS